MKYIKVSYEITQGNIWNILKNHMKNLKETCEISQGSHDICQGLIKNLKETHHLCQGSSSYMSTKHMIYVKEIHHISQGNSSYISRNLIIYVKETHHIC